MSALGRLWRDTRANVTFIFAGALAMLLGTSALGIDAGLAFVAKRRLQGATDAAVMAAAADPANARRAAEAVLRANGLADAAVVTLEPGSYAADPARPLHERFVPGAGDAIRLVVAGRSRTHIAGALGLAGDIAITARATATRSALAGFSIGSRVADVDGGPAVRWLSLLAGADLGLTLLDYRALAAGRIDVLTFADALRTELHLDGGTFDEALAVQASWPLVVRAMALAADDAGTAATLRMLAARLPATPVRMDRLLDLGPYGATVRTATPGPVAADALAMLRAVLELGGGARQLAGNLDLGIPGIAQVRTRVAIGDRPARSPWLAIGARGAVVRTAQLRLWVEVHALGGLPAGLGTLRVPLLVELAPAEARLDEVACTRADKRVVLTVIPSLGRAAIANIDTAAFAALDRPLALRPALLAQAPLASVTGLADLTLGSEPRALTLDAADIAHHRVRSVETADVTRSLARALAGRVALRAEVLGLGLDGGALAGVVGTALQTIAPALDLVLARVGDLAGVGLGEADIAIDGVRCGVPVLVG